MLRRKRKRRALYRVWPGQPACSSWKEKICEKNLSAPGANSWSVFSKKLVKTSGSLTSSAAPKMSCSESRRSSPLKASSPKNRTQSTKAAGAAAPGSNSRSLRTKQVTILFLLIALSGLGREGALRPDRPKPSYSLDREREPFRGRCVGVTDGDTIRELPSSIARRPDSRLAPAPNKP